MAKHEKHKGEGQEAAGGARKKKGGKKKWIIIAVVLIIIIAAAGGGTDETSESSDGSDTVAEQTTDDSADVEESPDEAEAADVAEEEDEEDAEPSFSEDEAMRALTVACSNGIWSTDAYADEGEDVDESTAPIGVYGALIEDEMHPYDDSQSGTYLYGSRYDDCYAVDSDTWHIDGLDLDSYENSLLTDYEFDVSGDVSFDGEYYWVSNVTMEYEKYATDENGDIDVLGGVQDGTWVEDEFSDEPFKVSPSLIEDGE